MDLDVRGPRARRSASSSATCPSTTASRPTRPATDFVTHMARMSGLPAAAARERTAEVLRHVGLYEERYRAIGGYSTGMKQRVKLAQALVHDPRLLLLDEPTNGLDPAGRDEMLALVRRTGTEFGIAVIVASHLLGEIERICDFLVAIDAGRLLRAAPLGSFTERTGVLAVEVEEGEDALAGALVGRGLQAVADGRTVAPGVEETAVRHRPRQHRGPGAGAGPPRAAPPEPRGPVPDDAATRPRPRRECRAAHRRPRSVVSGPPAQRPSASGPGGSIYDLGYQGYDGPRLGRRSAVAALFAQTVRGLFRDRARRPGQDRAARARRPGDPPGRPRGRLAALIAQAGRRRSARDASPITYASYHGVIVYPDHAVLRGAGTRAVRARPALRRPAAVLLARPDPPDYALAKLGGLIVALLIVSSRRSSPVRRARPVAPDPVTGLTDESPPCPSSCSRVC